MQTNNAHCADRSCSAKNYKTCIPYKCFYVKLSKNERQFLKYIVLFCMKKKRQRQQLKMDDSFESIVLFFIKNLSVSEADMPPGLTEGLRETIAG